MKEIMNTKQIFLKNIFFLLTITTTSTGILKAIPVSITKMPDICTIGFFHLCTTQDSLYEREIQTFLARLNKSTKKTMVLIEAPASELRKVIESKSSNINILHKLALQYFKPETQISEDLFQQENILFKQCDIRQPHLYNLLHLIKILPEEYRYLKITDPAKLPIVAELRKRIIEIFEITTQEKFITETQSTIEKIITFTCSLKKESIEDNPEYSAMLKFIIPIGIAFQEMKEFFITNNFPTCAEAFINVIQNQTSTYEEFVNKKCLWLNSLVRNIGDAGMLMQIIQNRHDNIRTILMAGNGHVVRINASLTELGIVPIESSGLTRLDYHPDSEIIEEKEAEQISLSLDIPQLKKILDSTFERKCNNPRCNNIGNQICARCHNAYYCSRDCQRAHWKKHKTVCPSVSEK